MWNIMIAHGKGLLRNRMLTFWTLLFPLLLSTFISVTVAPAYSKQIKQEVISIAVVNSDTMSEDTTFKSVLEEVSKGEDAVFKVTYVNENEAKQALQDDEIIAYISKDEAFQIEVKQTGIEQTIVRSFMNEYSQKVTMIQDLMNHGASYEQIQDAFTDTISFMQSDQAEDGDIGYIYFYSIMAMTMLYGGYWIMRAMHNQRADHSDVGQRNALAPTSKSKMLCADFLLTLTIHYAIQMIVLLYMIFILNVNFGDSLPAILLLIAVGTIAGNAIGVVISLYGPKNFDGATSVMTSFTLLSCALAGMMMVDLKYLVQVNAPWLAAINPGTLITDAFYAQLYYGVGERYLINLGSLVIFSILCYVIAFIRLRRKQYASL